MEPVETPLNTRFRYKLVLGKYPVVKIKPTIGGQQVTLRINEGISLTAIVPDGSDVKLNDLLTLYTEVLVDAKALQSPQQ